MHKNSYQYSKSCSKRRIADVKGKKFLLIVDETTKVSTPKQLCAIIRYYSSVKKEIVTAFVDLVTVFHACNDNLFNARLPS